MNKTWFIYDEKRNDVFLCGYAGLGRKLLETNGRAIDADAELSAVSELEVLANWYLRSVLLLVLELKLLPRAGCWQTVLTRFLFLFSFLILEELL